MAFANVALTDTFDTWRTRTNQIVVLGTNITEGYHLTTGTLNSSNTGAAVNVTAGYIKVKSNVFDSNVVTVVSNTTGITVSGTGRLGTIVYLNGNVTNTIYDASSANIASANSVNTLNQLLIAGLVGANTWSNTTLTGFLAYTNTSTAAVNSYASILASNNAVGANTWANSIALGANTWANAMVASVNAWANAVGTKANNYANASFTTIANGNAAFAKANTALQNTTGTFNGTLNVSSHLNVTGNVVVANTIVANKNAFMPFTTLTDAATVSVDLSLTNNFKLTLGGNRTLDNPTNLTPGQSGVIFISQDATGSRTLSFGNYWNFPSGIAPTMTGTASATDALVYVVRTSTNVASQIIYNVG